MCIQMERKELAKIFIIFFKLIIFKTVVASLIFADFKLHVFLKAH